MAKPPSKGSPLTFRKIVSKHLWRKYVTQERVEWWWRKFHVARRRRVWKLSEQQNHRCCYCSRLTWVYDNTINVDPKYQSDRLPGMTVLEMATADHFIPDAKGGSESISNTIMCCMRCNELRGDRDAFEFWEIMQSANNIRGVLRMSKKLRKREKTAEKTEKRVDKQIAFGIWLGYLRFVSPEWRAVFDALSDAIAEIEVEQEKHWRDRYGDLIDSDPREVELPRDRVWAEMMRAA